MAMRLIVIFVITALVLSDGGMVSAAPRFSDWGTPEWLGAAVNSSAEDAGPAISKDGLALYFYSTRTGGQGGEDIYVSRRSSSTAPWGLPVNLGPTINTTSNERVPAFSRDGHRMFFVSNRSGGAGGLDIWVSYRLHTHEDFGEFGWQAPSPVLGVNTPFNEAGPSYFQDDETSTAFLYFNSNKPGGLGSADIYVAVEQPDGSFDAVSNVTALNSPFFDARATISHDGLEIIFSSNRATGSPLGQLDLWSATRDSTSSAWSTPTSLTKLNTTANDYTTYLSSDRQAIYFASERSGGLGAGDLWVSTRTKSAGRP